MMTQGNLYVVATPIGNLEDISLRAVKTIFKTEILACEDTRRTGILLSKLYKIYKDFLQLPDKKPHLVSYYDQVEQQRIPYIVSQLLQGSDVALISDAGTPLVCDPGYRLVVECFKRSINVFSIPGPTALISALSVSGFPVDRFVFLGFLPKKQNDRRKLLMQWQDVVKSTRSQLLLVFYETPHRLNESLADFLLVFGDREITVCRELTKVHEQIFKAKISLAINAFNSTKGEIVLVFNCLN